MTISNQAPSVFAFNEFSVRAFADQQGNPWFSAPEACTILGYRNSRDAIAKHCRPDGVAKRDTIDSMGRTQEMTFINEGNLYRLIIKSRKPEAEKFEQLVMEEILPAIRKTGSYTAPNQEPVAPSLIGRRWLVSYDHDGKECVTPVASDALVMPLGALLKQMVAPNGLHISTEALFDFVEAATANLKQRSAYQAQRLQQARQISL